MAQGKYRNYPCPCNSGKKYKKCCMREDQKKREYAQKGVVLTSKI